MATAGAKTFFAALAAATLAGCASAPDRNAQPPGNNEIRESSGRDGSSPAESDRADGGKLERPAPEKLEPAGDSFDAGGDLSDPQRARDDEVEADSDGPARLDLTDM